MTGVYEHTFDGKLLPRHLKMLRDTDSGRIELRYWKFEPILLFLIPFMSVWSGGAIFGCYVVPFLQHDTHPMNYMPLLFGIPFLVVSIFIWYGILPMRKAESQEPVLRRRYIVSASITHSECLRR